MWPLCEKWGHNECVHLQKETLEICRVRQAAMEEDSGEDRKVYDG